MEGVRNALSTLFSIQSRLYNQSQVAVKSKITGDRLHILKNVVLQVIQEILDELFCRL